MTDAELEICRHGLRVVANRYGLIVAKSADHEVANAATATFVEIDGHKFVVTAAHVFSGLAERGHVRLQVMRPEALAAAETARHGLEFDLPSSSHFPVHLGDEDHLDLAVFCAPDDLRAASHLGWFSADEGVSVIRQLRDEVPCHRDPRLAGMLLGYPIFSRFRDSELRTQTFGAFPIWAIIERFDDPPEITGRSPQVVLEVDAPTPEVIPADASRLVRDSVEQFWAMRDANLTSEDDPTPLGGYSGGPLVYLCESGQYLLGTTKRGGVRLGGHAFVTPLDAIVYAVRTAEGSGCSTSPAPLGKSR